MANGRLNAVEVLSAEQRRFLHGGDPGESEETAKTKTKRGNRRPEPTPGPVACSPARNDGQGRSTRTGTTRQSASAIRGTGLKSVTLRLNPGIVRALRKAAAERTIDYVTPYTQQAIAETALIGWLTDEGYAIET